MLIGHFSSDKLVDGFVDFFDGFLVLFFHSLHNAVLQMLLEERLAGVVDFCLDGSQLNQNIRTVLPVFDQFSIIRFTASRCPIDLERRFTIFRISAGEWVCE